MDMIKTCFILITLMPILVLSQDHKLSGFDHLVNKTWTADGSWSDGTKFKQDIHFTYDLNKTLVIAKSKGYTNKEQTEYGNRNHGIRQYNASKDCIEFWEFDIFGGVTQGTVVFKGKNIYYHYTYGSSVVTDGWEYIDNETYKFTVGSFKDDKWEAVYLQTEFRLDNE